MPLPLPRLVLAWALIGSALGGGGWAGAEPPKIGKPRPAPGPPNMPPLPPAAIDEALEIGGDDVEARKRETRLTVEVRVNGRGPYQFVVDSGADTSVVGLRIAHDLELPLGTPVVLNNMTDRNIVDRVHVAELSLGPSTIRNLQLPALREADLGGAGMIGIDALARQRLMMDFEKKLIRVEDASKPVRSMPGDIVVTARLQRGQLILTEVKAGPVTLDAVVDTGSQISIGNSALREKLVKRRLHKLETVTAIGVTGTVVKLHVARIDELRLGSVTLGNVPIAFADVPPFKVFGLADRPALLLGTDLLGTFRRVSLDFRARKVRFQLRRCQQSLTIGSSVAASVTRVTSTSGEACAR
ncbi:MAG TPA: retroviral-like aspartic protease family protein [Allosphingosinicella sp.]|nr:retroviral-like aspartic protease family protein [Allosphingosinicella sp.]